MQDELSARLGAGPWKLLVSSSELLLALRDRPGGVLSDLNQLHPEGAVLAGDLSEMVPSDLLNFLHQGRRTGVLLARSDAVERGIAMVDGNVAWACSTSPGERLGELLVRSGLARHDRIEAALREQSTRTAEHRRIGQILVDKGVIRPDELWHGLRHQTVEIFLGLLVARTGNFVFLRGLDRERLPTKLDIDTQGLLLDGLRRLDEMELYRTLVRDFAMVLKPTGKAVPKLSDEALHLLALIDGKKTLSDLASATALGDFETAKAAYKLLETGCVTVDARPA